MSFIATDFKSGDPLRKVCNARNLSRIGNVLMSMEVYGGRLVRSYGAEGTDWKLIIDGSSSARLPDGASFATSDRLFAVDSLSLGRLGRLNFTGNDSAGYAAGLTRNVHVSHDVCADSTFSGVAFRQLRLYLKVSDTVAAPVEVLGRTAGGKLVWVTTTDTCAPP